MESFQLTASQWVVTLAGFVESSLLLGAAPGWRILLGAAALTTSGVLLLKSRPTDSALVTLLSTDPPSER
jgi:hypothetical protein